jgi:hypothetical protein
MLVLVCLDKPDDTPRLRVDARFGLFGDRANLDAYRCTVCVERIIGSKIVLDAPNDTPW